MKTILNHFALKYKIMIKDNQRAYQELKKLQSLSLVEKVSCFFELGLTLIQTAPDISAEEAKGIPDCMQVLGIKAVLNFSILAYLILEAVKNLMGSNKYQN